MLGRATGRKTAAEDYQPLLDHPPEDDRVVFSADAEDDGDDEAYIPNYRDDTHDNATVNAPQGRGDGERFVRSGPPLRSTVQSREARKQLLTIPPAQALARRHSSSSNAHSARVEFDLDDDVLEDGDLLPRESFRHSLRRDGSASPMPLIVGLAESMHQRRASLDGADGIDLEELAQRKDKGGGMLDSIANMANSILGAGVCLF